MNRYLQILLLVICAIAQVAWAPFLIAWGVSLPIVVIFLWFVKNNVTFTELSVYAFISGIIIDLLSIDLLGLHTMVLLLSIGVMTLAENNTTVQNKFASRLLGIVLGLGGYVYMVQLLQNFL